MNGLERLMEAGAPASLKEVAGVDGIALAEVALADARAALETLHQHCDYESVTLITAIDHDTPPIAGARPRFEVLWQLHSLKHGDRIRLRTRVTEQEAEDPSVVDLWPAAGFMERECFDLFGVRFAGNPDLRRLLMPEGYDYHPLRKDFPQVGIEPDRLYREWERGRPR